MWVSSAASAGRLGFRWALSCSRCWGFTWGEVGSWSHHLHSQLCDSQACFLQQMSQESAQNQPKWHEKHWKEKGISFLPKEGKKWCAHIDLVIARWDPVTAWIRNLQMTCQGKTLWKALLPDRLWGCVTARGHNNYFFKCHFKHSFLLIITRAHSWHKVPLYSISS